MKDINTFCKQIKKTMTKNKKDYHDIDDLNIETVYINNIEQKCLVIKEINGISLTFNLDEYFNIFKNNNISIDLITEEIFRKYIKYRSNYKPIMNSLLSKKKIIENTRIVLVNKDKNIKYFKKNNIVFIEKGDFLIEFRYFLKTFKDGSDDEISFVIKENVIIEAEISTEELLRNAYKKLINESINYFKYNIASLSNDSKTFGASLILREDILKQICLKMNVEEIIIIPCSIHNCMILSANEYSGNELEKILREMNKTLISPDEVLSNYIHYYKKSELFYYRENEKIVINLQEF